MTIKVPKSVTKRALRKHHPEGDKGPEAPKYVPGASDAQVQEELPNRETDFHSTNPLAVYLRTNGISATAFAQAMGMPFKTIYNWMKGEVIPSLEAAWLCERVTKGVIPMEAWLGLPSAKKQLATWRAKQPEDMKDWSKQDGPDAGGYARSLKKSQRSKKEAHDAPEED